MSEREIITVPDSIEPVVGFRMWRVMVDGPQRGLLRSLVKETVWIPNTEMRAECLSDRKHSEPPVASCNCGFWALKSIEKCLAYNHSRDCAVIGEVALWGRVLVGRDGWRAEYAYPRRVVGFISNGADPEFVQETYGVDVRSQDSPEELVKKLNIKLGFINGSVNV